MGLVCTRENFVSTNLKSSVAAVCVPKVLLPASLGSTEGYGRGSLTSHTLRTKKKRQKGLVTAYKALFYSPSIDGEAYFVKGVAYETLP